MAEFRSNIAKLRQLSEEMRTASREGGPLDGALSELKTSAQALSDNGSLGTLGYGEMVDEIRAYVENRFAVQRAQASTLASIADLVERYENQVLMDGGAEPLEGYEAALSDQAMEGSVDAAIWATDAGDVTQSYLDAGVPMEALAGAAGTAAGEGGFHSFITGDIEAAGAALSRTMSTEGELLGMDAKASTTGEFLAGKVSFKPDGKLDLITGNAYAGVEAKAEGSVERLAGEVDLGYGHAEAEVKALTGAASGKASISFLKNGEFDPSIEASAEAKVSAISANAKAQVGNDVVNIHGSAEGEVLTASANAGVSVSKDGVEVSAGAEAYLATGEVKGGFKILGIEINASAKGHAGGAGVKVSGGINTDKKKLSFKAGAGLLLGGGLGLEVDYSDAGKGIDEAIDAVNEWWDSW